MQNNSTVNTDAASLHLRAQGHDPDANSFLPHALTSQRAPLSGHLLQVQDVQALVEAVHGGHGRGLEHQQVLVQRGEAGGGGQALDALQQVSVLALGLGHHLEGSQKN